VIPEEAQDGWVMQMIHIHKTGEMSVMKNPMSLFYVIGAMVRTTCQGIPADTAV
jgi:hypothetical protein